jgi:lysophospholipase L1-like esterase
MRVVEKALLFAFSIIVAILFAESSVRVYLYAKEMYSSREGFDYRVTPSVYVEYDEQHGERFKPNAEFWISLIRNGKLVWGTCCGRSNEDGLGGISTIREFNEADIKILVFGDSCTHWNQDGVTWPDLLQENLRKALGKSVVVLNYARGTYGVLQMLDLAADKVEQHRPDLFIIAPIGDDFTRARWWSKEIEQDGITRWMLSSRKDEFLDYCFAVDELIVNRKATREWCEQNLASGGDGEPLLTEINKQYAKLKSEVKAVRNPFNILTLEHSYLYNWLTTGNPLAYVPGIIPRVSFSDYREDFKASSDLSRLQSTDSSMILVYLPMFAEMKCRCCIVNEQTRSLMSSLENMSGQPIRLIQDDYKGPLPSKMDLLPYDLHPNRAGLQFWADAVTEIVLSQLRDRAR